MIMHKEQASGKWFTLPLVDQLANVGMDVYRTINWKQRGDLEESNAAFYRALELLSLTIKDPKNKKRLKELGRVRETLIDHFVYDNEYQTTDESWNNYFYAFNYAAALRRGR